MWVQIWVQMCAVAALVPSTASPVQQLFHHGAVVTDAARCTALGTHVLARHGSSVDAAIASALCAGIVNPHTSGLGG